MNEIELAYLQGREDGFYKTAAEEELVYDPGLKGTAISYLTGGLGAHLGAAAGGVVLGVPGAIAGGMAGDYLGSKMYLESDGMPEGEYGAKRYLTSKLYGLGKGIAYATPGAVLAGVGTATGNVPLAILGTAGTYAGATYGYLSGERDGLKVYAPKKERVAIVPVKTAAEDTGHSLQYDMQKAYTNSLGTGIVGLLGAGAGALAGRKYLPSLKFGPRTLSNGDKMLAGALAGTALGGKIGLEASNVINDKINPYR